MKIYKLEYAYDMFMDGRMAEGVHLFSTMDKLFQFCELRYGKTKEDFEYCGNNFYLCESEDLGEYDSESWCISEVILDKDLEEELLSEKQNYKDYEY